MKTNGAWTGCRNNRIFILLILVLLYPGRGPEGIFAAENDDAILLDAGSKAPTFSLPTVSNDRISLRTWCGEKLNKPHINDVKHIVVLSFWATWCKPCKKEIPLLQRFAEKHKDDSIKVFLVSLDKEGKSIVAPHVKQKGYTLPVLLDPYQRTAERYGVKTVPSLFVLDPQGIVRYSVAGYDEEKDLIKTLDSVVDEIRGVHASADNSAMVDSLAADTVSDDSTHVNMVKGSDGLTPRQRWMAVVKVECGMPVDSVAAHFGASAEDIKTWYDDIKKAAISIWNTTPK